MKNAICFAALPLAHYIWSKSNASFKYYTTIWAICSQRTRILFHFTELCMFTHHDMNCSWRNMQFFISVSSVSLLSYTILLPSWSCLILLTSFKLHIWWTSTNNEDVHGMFIYKFMYLFLDRKWLYKTSTHSANHM